MSSKKKESSMRRLMRRAIRPTQSETSTGLALTPSRTTERTADGTDTHPCQNTPDQAHHQAPNLSLERALSLSILEAGRSAVEDDLPVQRRDSDLSLMSSASQGGNFCDLLESLESQTRQRLEVSSVRSHTSMASVDTLLPESHPTPPRKLTGLVADLKDKVEQGVIELPLITRIAVPPGGESIGLLMRGIRFQAKQKDIDSPLEGLYVRHVEPDSPADVAGVRRGDRVFCIQDGADLRASDNRLATHRLETLWRFLAEKTDARERLLNLHLLRREPLHSTHRVTANADGWAGIVLEGYVVVQLDKEGPAGRVGIRAGMEVIAVDDEPVVRLPFTLTQRLQAGESLVLDCIRADLALALGPPTHRLVETLF